MRVPAVSAILFVFSLSMLTIAGPWDRAAADGACIDAPGRTAPEGQRWYYRFDRERNRKCWHLGLANMAARDTPVLRSERAVGSTINSVFAPLVRGIKKLFRQPMPHEAAAGEPRIVQSDATKPLTIEDIAQQPEYPEERAEPRPRAPITPAQRKLFEEFLKWEETRRAGDGGAKTPAPSPASSP